MRKENEKQRYKEKDIDMLCAKNNTLHKGMPCTITKDITIKKLFFILLIIANNQTHKLDPKFILHYNLLN